MLNTFNYFNFLIIKKEFIFAAIGVAVVAICGIIAFTRNSDPVYRIAISNIESMTRDESITLTTCYTELSIPGEGDYLSLATPCNSQTTDNRIYKCLDQKQMNKGISGKCF